MGLAELSWDEQGFSLMSSLCSDMALNIDDKMRWHLKTDQSSNVSFVKLAKQIPYSLKVYIGIIVIESNLKLQLLCFLSAMMYHLTFESLKNENLVQLEIELNFLKFPQNEKH